MQQPLNGYENVLKRVFGHTEFRGKQQDVIEAAIAGRDVFVLAPTGMGKSLCFQLPAVTTEKGVTLVISPLCALMVNQVEKLREKSIAVVAWNSDTDIEERQTFEKDLLSASPQTRLLYISPERYATSDCIRLLDSIYKKRRLNRLVIDEAHCISEWGHSFRSDYRGLGKFRDRYSDVPIMALTATATPVVQRDIIYSLKIDKDDVFYAVHPFNREHLFYEVRYMSLLDSQTRKQHIFDYINLLHQRRKRPSSGIIYCRAKATCDDVSDFLRRNGLNAQPYHSGISQGVLKQTLKKWSAGGNGGQGTIDVVVATVAFGLGIDKGDVRYVIHYDLPTSFEGATSTAITKRQVGNLLYPHINLLNIDVREAFKMRPILLEDALGIRERVTISKPNRINDGFQGPSPTQRAKSSIDELIQYAENVATCRHIGICRYFGEDVDENKPDTVESLCDSMCDVCKYSDKTKKRITVLTPRDEVQIFRRQRQRPCQETSENLPEANKVIPLPVNGGIGTGENKRTNDAADSPGPPRATKKVKTGHISILKTLPFRSVNRLKKPFKSPLLTKDVNSQISNSRSVILSESGGSDSTAEAQGEPDIETESGMEEYTDSALDVETNERDYCQKELDSVPEDELESQFFATDVELENSISTKLPLPHRMKGFATIRRSMCSLKKRALRDLAHFNPNIDQWEKILQDSAREAEFAALSLSSTSNGYNILIRRTARAVSHLANPEQGQDEDVLSDAQDLMDIIRRHCKVWQNKAIQGV
ncbi:hypothetical protein AGABI2DRAFT_119677 [Agaricus bisporus var. bisporus H97]|uniref:hypothetical protein n=1 Tax=Agaricus bisporus var. bisporus (strain H97 / ATCC MYA-4626 / FGSC 10389) TaxID=936046 RepID=UPI00029F66AF|nr:hypothetical protein AGABI2DRAFT_119677 [Agaricus bisporus var. bisporus H97]EKV46019.1 hypothetical protein AGABI2DRAFT_119677 [Agaricus bisporus var. bisporus H97]